MAGLTSGHDLGECVNAKVRENHRFMISNLSIEFPEVSQTKLLRIVTDTIRLS